MRLTINKAVTHIFLIASLALLIYSNTFHQPFQFDDPYNIIDKPYVEDIRSFFSPAQTKWFGTDHGFRMRPVGYFTFALNYLWGGSDTTGYHVFNLVIHILNALLVYRLVVLTFRTPFFMSSPLRESSNLIGLISALIFVSHPVQTEAVTYIVQRLASLATLFYLLSLVSYIRSRLVSSEDLPKAGFLFWYISSLISAVLAMKTKEISFTLPVIIVLYDFMFFRGTFKRRAILLIPVLLTMIIIPSGLIGWGKSAGEVISDLSEVTRAGPTVTRMDYLFTELRVIVSYVRLLFFPFNQNLDYDYRVLSSFLDVRVMLSFIFLSLLFGLGLYLLWSSRKTSSHLRLVSMGIFWFFITLSVESSVIPITDFIFEHRLYLPSVGFSVAISSSVIVRAERLKRIGLEKRFVAILFFGAVTLFFSGLTYTRNMVWQSEVSLWEDVIKKSPEKARGYNGLGLAYQHRGDYDRAKDNYRKALAIDPLYAVALNNLGGAYHSKGAYDSAIDAYTSAIHLEPDTQNFYNNRGLSYAAKGEYERAEDDYQKAISLDPDFAYAHHNLGFVYHSRQLYDKAIEEYTRAISLAPNNSVFRSNRGLSYLAKGEFERAIEDFNRAISLDPNSVNSYNGRGISLAQLGRPDDAVADFTRAISLRPGDGKYYSNRGLAFEMEGNRDQAVRDFEKACEMREESGCKRLEVMKKR